VKRRSKIRSDRSGVGVLGWDLGRPGHLAEVKRSANDCSTTKRHVKYGGAERILGERER
jgi:hypothetical protein